MVGVHFQPNAVYLMAVWKTATTYLYSDELKILTYTILIILPIGFPQSRFNKILKIFIQ